MLDEDTRELEGRATYRLVGNVLHEGKPEAGSYKAQAVHRAEGGWYELQELHVSGIEEEFVSFSEVILLGCAKLPLVIKHSPWLSAARVLISQHGQLTQSVGGDFTLIFHVFLY